MPVTVGGEVAALLYADDGGVAERTAPASWPETLELLSRHAARCLEAQTAIRAARLGVKAPLAAPAGGRHVADSQGEDTARRYARLVVSDIRLSHELNDGVILEEGEPTGLAESRQAREIYLGERFRL